MAEQVIKVCDHPGDGHEGKVSGYEVRLPTGQAVAVDLCEAHAVTLHELAGHGRRASARRRSASKRKSFSVTPLSDIS